MGNELISITVPSGLSLGFGVSGEASFSPEFDQIYESAQRRGGVYRQEDGGWTLDGVKLEYTP